MIFIIGLIGCKKEDPSISIKTLPTEIHGDSIFLRGEIVSVGSHTISEHGFIFRIPASPSKAGYDSVFYVNRQATKGIFSIPIINDLEQDEAYYIRYFTGSTQETIYANQITILGEGKLKPAISSFTPSRGYDGDLVLINGSHFNLHDSPLKVYFGEKEATIIEINDQSILIKVPEYEFREECKIKIVQEEDVTFSEDSFTLNGPYISHFTPNNANGEVLITLTGENFSDIPWQNELIIGIHSTDIIESSDHEIKARINTTNIIPGAYPLILSAHQKKFLTEEVFTVTSPWKECPPLPVEGFCSASVFEFNNSIYICTGSTSWLSTGGYTDSFFKYEIATATWTQLNDYPGGKRIGLNSLVLGSKAYIGTGTKGGFDDYSDFWEFNPMTEEWIRMDDYPGGECSGLRSIEYQDKGYYMQFSIDSKPFYCFDPENKTWTELPEFPGIKRSGAELGIINDILYVVGGSNSNQSSFIPDIWAYDFSTQEWRFISEFNSDARPNHSFTYENHFFMIEQGYNDAHDLSFMLMYEYNPETDEKVNDLYIFPGMARNRSFCIISGEKLYYGTGSIGGFGECLNDMWSYDLSSK